MRSDSAMAASALRPDGESVMPSAGTPVLFSMALLTIAAGLTYLVPAAVAAHHRRLWHASLFTVLAVLTALNLGFASQVSAFSPPVPLETTRVWGVWLQEALLPCL